MPDWSLNYELKNEIFIDHVSWDAKKKVFKYEDDELSRRIMMAIKAQQKKSNKK